MLSRSPAVMAVDEYRRWKTRKCIAIAIILCFLENTPSNINKNIELKQRGKERQEELYKTIDLITVLMQSLHVGMRPPGSLVTRTKEMLAC